MISSTIRIYRLIQRRDKSRIHKNDMPKNENNLILWDKEKLKPEAVKAFENIVKLCKNEKNQVYGNYNACSKGNVRKISKQF